jgi:methionyl aminopeptidase
VKVDIGVELEGYYGDSATTIPVGKISPEAERLLRVTQESLEAAIQNMVEGRKLFDVCGAVQQHVEQEGFSVVREFVGHGIGSKLHEEPQVPNYVDAKMSNPRLREGVVLAIEPMVSAGGPRTKVLDDRWTAVTKDGSRAAHFEHCVAVTSNGPWVLTRP